MAELQRKKRILLVEDSQSNAMVYQKYLQDNYHVELAFDGASAEKKFQQGDWSLILLDIQLPDTSGMELLQIFRKHDELLPVVIITAHGSVDIALEAMRHGANDFLSKPFDRARLEVTVAKQLREKQLNDLVHEYEKTCARESFGRMVGSSLPMQGVYNIIESAASSKASVFITGESGTGKELCAEAIHKAGDRAEHEFVALNCAAIPHDLIESEIFGHVKGAFTGASSARQGAAARAHQGTLFLDEIGEMPMSLQSKLLRFIQTGRYQPVGSNKEYQVDIRFVCATNRDPLEEVKQSRFREDLYYRLHVIPIHMPPLRDRGQDVILIARALLAKYTEDEGKRFIGFSRDVEKVLCQYSWPGNVRELGNVIRNILVLNDSEIVTPDMLPPALNKEPVSDSLISQNVKVGNSAESPPQDLALSSESPAAVAHDFQSKGLTNGTSTGYQLSEEIKPLWLAEKEYIEQVIEKCRGNIPRAAAFLEVSASTIYRKKQQWEKLQEVVD